MKMKKLVAAALSLVTAFSLVACGGGDTASGTATGSTTGGSSSSDAVTLKWVTVGNSMPSNYTAWQKNMNEYLEKEIGVNIDVEVVSWGDWQTRRPTIVSTASDYDIIFTNSETYTNDVAIGAFADLTDIIDTSAPELKAMIPENYWEACLIDGKLYSIPTYKDSSQSEFIVWDKDKTDELGIDPSTISTLDEMTPALEKIYDSTGEPSFVLYNTGANYLYYEYDNMSTGLPAIGVRYDDEDATVVYTFEQDDLLGYLKTYREWYEAGYINSDAAVKPEQKEYRPVQIAQGWSGATRKAWGPEVGIENAVAYQWGPTVMSNDTVRGSLNCISANSKNKEKALEFLQLVNTDSYVRDSFYYGLEGEDWEYVGEGDAKRVHRLSSDWSMAGYTQGSFFTVTQEDTSEINDWDEVKELNEKAEPSVLLGFTFDPTNVKDKLTNCLTIYERYKSELITGSVDPTVAVPEMKAEMQKAGFDDIVAEAQTQVDAFIAQK